MRKTYIVNPSSPFIIYFNHTEDYDDFMDEYSEVEGFSFIKGEKGYRLFTNSHIYNAYCFIDKNDPDKTAIGIGISSRTPIHQRITLDIAFKAVRVRGLASYHACYKGLSRAPIYSNGAEKFFNFIDEYFDSIVSEYEKDTEVENDEYINFLDTYEEIIEREEDFSLLNPFEAEYCEINSVQQNDNDGVVYKFKTTSRTKNPKSKTMVKVFSADKTSKYNATVVGCDRTGVYLRFSKHSSFSYTESSSCGTITESVNVEYPLKKKAIRALRNNSCANKKFLDVIIGKKLLPLEIKKEYSPYDSEGNLAARVNSSQTDAINKALNTNDFLLVQGPPGTGKTTIITEMVKSFVQDGLKVLICSKNNLPVDNVIEKCKDLYHDKDKTKKMLCLRLGQEDNVLTSVRSQLSRPLALSIEGNVKERSITAREERLSHEDSILKLCAEAEKSVGNFDGTITYFANQHNFFDKAEKAFTKTFSGIFFSLFLGSERRKTIKSSIAEIKKQAYNIALMTAEPFKYESYDVFEGYIKTLLSFVSLYFDAVTSVRHELTSAPKRYKWAFGKLFEKISATAGESSDKRGFFNKKIEEAMRSFKGNPAANLYNECTSPDRSPIETFNRFVCALNDQKNCAEATKIRFESILNEWHEELMADQKVIEEPLVQCVKIIGATCIGVNTTPAFTNAEYDVAIVDEAGQITAFDLLVPLIKAKKIILIGDHLQLPPSGNNDFCNYVKKNNLFNFEESSTVKNINDMKKLYSVSLFEKLFRDPAFSKNKVMLDTQFRMNPIIANFISENFYEGKYKNGVTKEDRTLSIGGLTNPIYFIDTVNSKNKYEYLSEDDENNEKDLAVSEIIDDNEEDEREDDKEFTNILEAQILADHIVRIIIDIENNTFSGTPKKLKDENGDYDIGVITAYKNQIKVIYDCIREKLSSYFNELQTDEIISHLSVNTLDSFQGRDNQIIFYSFVRSNPEHKIGFLHELRRINVMMTRAKSLLVMIGDSETLTNSGKRAIHNREKTDEFYNRLIKYCKDNNGYIAIDA